MARETLTAEKNIEAAVGLLDMMASTASTCGPPEPSGVSVAKDSFYEVAWIEAAVLDDIDPHESDAAWRAYTTRPHAPAKYKHMPKSGSSPGPVFENVP